MVIGNRRKNCANQNNSRKATSRSGQACCDVTFPALKTDTRFRLSRRWKRWHARWKCQCIASFMKAKQQHQFAI